MRHPDIINIPIREHVLEGDEHGFVWYCTDYCYGGAIDIYHQGLLDLNGLTGTIVVCHRQEGDGYSGACGEYEIPRRRWLSCEDFTANEKLYLEEMLLCNERLIMDAVRGL